MDNKSIFNFIFTQMEKLDKGIIDTEQAKAQSDLSKQANNCLRYELEKAKTLIKIAQHNKASGDSIEINNIEKK